MTLDEARMRSRLLDAGRLAALFPHPVLLVSGTPYAVPAQTEEEATQRPDPNVRLETRVPVPNQAGPSVLVIPVAPAPFRPDSNRLVVGRAPTCDVKLPFLSVSKVHAYLWESSPGRWLIQDASSRHGTATKEGPVPTDRGIPIEDGADIIFGGVPAVFHSAESFRDELIAGRA